MNLKALELALGVATEERRRDGSSKLVSICEDQDVRVAARVGKNIREERSGDGAAHLA